MNTNRNPQGRPRETGPCRKCGSNEFTLRRKVTIYVPTVGLPRECETLSRQCVPCTRALRKAAKARARARVALAA